MIQNITDINGSWEKSPPKLGDPVATPAFASETYDSTARYYAIGKAPLETNLGQFSVGDSVALFSFQGNDCFGPVSILVPSDPFIQAAENAVSLNVRSSFYSRSGQPAGGNQDPQEQFIDKLGPDADCRNDLMLTKMVSNNNPDVGSNVVFTLTVTNSGPGNATGVAVQDQLPSGYTYVSDNGANAAVYNEITGIWTIDSIAAGGSAILQITARVNPSGDYLNYAQISASNEPDTDSTPGNGPQNPDEDDDDQMATTPVPVADLSISKTNGTTTYTPGSPITYTIVVSNNGPSGVTAATVTDNIPVAITGVSWISTTQGTASVSSGATGTGNSLSATVNLPAGAGNTVTFTVSGTVSSSASGDLVNTASVLPPPGTTDPEPGNNKNTDTDTYSPVIVATFDNLSTVASGGSLTKPLLVNDTLNGVGNFNPALVNITIADSPNKGTVSINPTTGEVTYTPNAGASGVDSLVYQICDKLSPTVCDTALVVVTITPVIDAVRDVAGNVPSGSSLTYPLLTNDTLNEVGNFDPTLVNTTVVDFPDKGTASINPTTGQLVYTPTPGFSGADSLLYKICDVLNPTVCDSAWVSFTITPVIVASYDNLGTVASGASLTKPLLVNDTLNGVGNFNPALVNITIADSPNKGTVSINPATGEVTYTPNAGASGVDSLVYQICDKLNPTFCDTALVVVTIAPVIVASYDNLGVVALGGGLTRPLLVNDTLNGVGNFNPALVNITITDSPNKGTASINPATGEVTYTPNAGASGVDSLVYRICDVLNPTVCDTALVVVRIEDALLLLPKVYLQGSLFGVTYTDAPANTVVDSLMRDDLRAQNLIPLTSPYGYLNPTVSDNTINASVLSTTGRNAIVDWVFVELRSASDSTVILNSRSALLQRDGDVVGLDGVSPLDVRALSGTSYYVAVRHRNHLAVMTAGAIPLTPAGVVVDFRQPSTPTYLKGAAPINQAQVVVVQGRAMWAGNALIDRNVIYQGTANDVNVVAQQVLGAPGNTFQQPNYILKGYFGGDINMNGEVIFQGTRNDVEYIYQNVIKNHPGNLLVDNFFVIQQQLPE
jgi:uncharacterized repeat protein (TIGR01451 family)